MLTDAAAAGAPVAGSVDDTVIERAQAALEAITAFFDEAIREDLSALVAARNALRLSDGNAAPLAALRAGAEGLEAQGSLYGMPLVAALAGSLHKLVAKAPAAHALPIDLVDAHLDALKAIADGRSDRAESSIVICHLRNTVRQTVVGWAHAGA
ncbi:MAG: hypothetical protein U1E87_03005 [Alphaproteobacteria bacterium]